MNTQYELVTTAEQLQRAVEQLAGRQVIGVDTETTDLDPHLARLRLMQLATPEGVFILDLDRFAGSDLKHGEEFASLRRLIAAARPIKIAHNAKFDAKFIKHNFGVDIGGLFDTLLASQLVSAGDIEERPPDAISMRPWTRASV
jgi:DNA polymerase I